MDLTWRQRVIEVIRQSSVAVQRLGAYAGMRRYEGVIRKFRDKLSEAGKEPLLG